MQENEINAQTILCIPGKWKNESEMVSSMVGNNVGEYLFAGRILMHIKTKEFFQVDISEHDENMRESFRWAGLVNRVSEAFLDEIAEHTLVIYLIGQTGSLQSAESIARAGNAILKAGGIGLKVETAGKAFTAEQWQNLVDNFETADLYKMFVLDSLTDEEGTTFSCGMHNLGLRDTIISNEEFGEAVSVISMFGYYQFIDKPVIMNNQTFAQAANAPVYRISEEPNQPYQGHELFENPFGMWRLQRK